MVQSAGVVCFCPLKASHQNKERRHSLVKVGERKSGLQCHKQMLFDHNSASDASWIAGVCWEMKI